MVGSHLLTGFSITPCSHKQLAYDEDALIKDIAFTMCFTTTITRFWALAFLGCLILSRPLWADDRADSQRLLLSIKQATLSQQVAKASCFVGLAFEQDKNLSALKQNIAQFEDTYRQIASNPDNAYLLATLKEFSPIWERILFATSLTLETPNLPGVDIDMMGALNDALLQKAKHVVQATYDNMQKSPFLNTVRHIAELGLLSQQSTKEFCYVTYGLFTALHRQSLQKSVAAFDTALNDLIDGNLDHEIIPAPNDEILMNLYQVRTQWLVMRPILMGVSEGALPNHKDLETITSLNTALLDLSDEISTLFVTAYEDYKNQETAPNEKDGKKTRAKKK